ncbi:TIGR03571 family LLM class oxidoreductase [Pontibacillus yanchengensis]|uniref:TIGR03571 family LLM class oxidoreductase n=2 Tax=Pontibacillus yanchengensis TaxID=462910 RepID=A0ACC7VAR7_9BACI|nr:TIGR03571 family LLM class oxidoreductase [Pontibacillus yanchengensis]MYL32841.1 TIGR03571 family LLM class oxidoreductase [Pontibacillus yanchengensis]MYL51753.1 TIGR03571 family LLM class oxidoreductase [Pontibacillus yanchengensis]
MGMQWNEHKGYSRMIKENKLTIGLTLPIEHHGNERPKMTQQVERVQLAERLGFSAIWFQDVLLEDPTFHDPSTGQVYDSLLYLTYIGAHTNIINLGTAAVVLSLRHPLRLAKEAATIENLFPERFMLGISSGDRRRDFEGLHIPIMERGKIFREGFHFFEHVLNREYEDYQSPLGKIEGATLVPKPNKPIPTFITGYAQQSLDWVAEHGDGWMFYPQALDKQQSLIEEYRNKVLEKRGNTFQPFFQPLVMDLAEDPNHEPEKITLGYKLGSNALITWLKKHEAIGVNHVMISLSNSTREVEEVMRELGEVVLPHFPPHHTFPY